MKPLRLLIPLVGVACVVLSITLAMNRLPTQTTVAGIYSDELAAGTVVSLEDAAILADLNVRAAWIEDREDPTREYTFSLLVNSTENGPEMLLRRFRRPPMGSRQEDDLIHYAIKGTLRADFFWGSGRRALAHAGVMRAAAEIYVLLPR